MTLGLGNSFVCWLIEEDLPVLQLIQKKLHPRKDLPEVAERAFVAPALASHSLEVKGLDYRLQLSKQSPILGSKKVFDGNPISLAFTKLELYEERLDVILLLDSSVDHEIRGVPSRVVAESEL
jgi:hypothetical protein